MIEGLLAIAETVNWRLRMGSGNPRAREMLIPKSAAAGRCKESKRRQMLPKETGEPTGKGLQQTKQTRVERCFLNQAGYARIEGKLEEKKMGGREDGGNVRRVCGGGGEVERWSVWEKS